MERYVTVATILTMQHSEQPIAMPIENITFF